MATVPQDVIIPPPDIKSIIEKTVGYVVRNGTGFISRIQDRERGNSKFSFLDEKDPYYGFFQWRLQEHKAGRGEAVAESKSKDAKANAKGNKPVRPVEFEFSVDLPPISPQDLDIMKITALYSAKNGPSFLTSLLRRESKNFQYDFLRPNHSLNPIFTKLVRQYKQVFNGLSADTETRLHEGASNRFDVLVRAKDRAEYFADEEDKQKKAAEEAERERIAFAQIDWHDFVVVEEIKFTSADIEQNLPAPITLSQLQFASLEQKRKGIYSIEEAPPDYDPEVSLETSKKSTKEKDTTQMNTRETRETPETPETTQQTQTQTQTQPRLPPGMKIRSAGTMRRSKADKEKMIKSTYTGEMIPESQYNEHVRIMLLDPKWKEQRAKEIERQSTTNLTTNEVDINLKRLASSRDDNAKRQKQ